MSMVHSRLIGNCTYIDYKNTLDTINSLKLKRSKEKRILKNTYLI